MRKSSMDRFLGKVVMVGKCWNWIGTRNTKTGRAYFKADDKNVIAARWFYEQLFGSIRPELVVMHSCDNVGCVRPRHLSLGTQIMNIADRDAKGRNRLSSAACASGHDLLSPGSVRNFGPQGRWRACRECHRLAMSRYRARYITRLEAEAHS